MSGQGHTVSEPDRDEPGDPRLELVSCDHCNHGTVSLERGARIVRRRCRECSGTGRVLRGEPVGVPYCLYLDFSLQGEGIGRG